MKKPHLKLKLNGQNITFKPEDLTGHIAVSRQFLSGFGGWLPNPDPILRKMGKQISVYRELLRDELVGSFVRRRKAAVARLDWKLSGDEVDDRGNSAKRFPRSIPGVIGSKVKKGEKDV